eukprot:GHVR01156691.1.p1 GENE.GHVR01156691.1~~GHVR01156691.1.p1  ORF type:complete len:324 (+),score=80.25 GHVR01156691.1:113-973(+)
MTSGTNDSKLFNLSRRQKAEYARKHNYCYYHLSCGGQPSSCRKPLLWRYFGFLLLQQNAINGVGPTFDWIFYSDDDAVISNENIPAMNILKNIIHESQSETVKNTDTAREKDTLTPRTIDLVVGTDPYCGCGPPFLINSGVMFIRNSSNLLKVSEYVLECARVPYTRYSFDDQRALLDFIILTGEILPDDITNICSIEPNDTNNPKRIVSKIGSTIVALPRLFNSPMRPQGWGDPLWSVWQPFDFIAHFSGQSFTSRIAMMKKGCDLERQHYPDMDHTLCKLVLKL